MLNPPQTYEMLPAAKTLLENGNVMDFSGYGGIIIADGDQLEIDKDDPLEQPDPAPDGFWWRIVLMDVINALGNPIEQSDKVMGYRFRVRIDVFPPNNDSLYAKHFLEGAHKKCYKAIHEKYVLLNDAEQLTWIKRNWLKRTSHTDRVKRFRYMTAEYFTGLGPTNS